jgi:aspartate ammonia-lyase
MDDKNFRIERDLLGEKQIPAESLHGIHTARAMENFSIAGQPVHRELVRAYGAVKLACALTNRDLGVWSDGKIPSAIEQACREMMDGSLGEHVTVDALQGGAGTSTNMNVNEVIANRALQILGKPLGTYSIVSPGDDVNLHQSTNDTFPTALRCAAIRGVRKLEAALVGLQESFQRKEKEFAHVVKIGRTELQDAVLMTLGREAGAWAEAQNRDRWRIYKCEERLRTVNLGGTAIGTGIGAPRDYIFKVVDALRMVTGIGFARSENLVDATANADVFVEVSGMLSACASSLIKISNDLRLLSSGPHAGFNEITLPPLQAGSSIMPGKINPVVPEACAQAGMLVMGNHAAIGMAAATGNLELNQNLPLVAHCLLQSIDCLTSACVMLAEKCVGRMAANERQCAAGVNNATASVTALVGTLGYETATEIAAQMRETGKDLRAIVMERGLLSAAKLDELLSAEAICRLGAPGILKRRDHHV